MRGGCVDTFTNQLTETRFSARRAFLTLVLSVVMMGHGAAAHAEDWQIAGYDPQHVKAGDMAAGGVTLNGTFSTYQEGRKVNLGKGNNVVADLSPHVIAWTQGQVRVLVPSGVAPGVHWIAVYAPGGELLAKGPETLVVIGTFDLATEQGGESKPQIKAGALKGLLKKKLAELEIKSIAGLPSHVCPDKTYNLSVTIVNHGDWPARFHLCSVGSIAGGCAIGQGPVHEIKGKSTMTLSMSLEPAAPFIESGKWHGKVFLGKVQSESADTMISVQGQGSPPAGSSDCNVGVSTSWTDAPGMSAGALFCDKNMDNHLVKLEVNTSPILCKGLKKKAIKGSTSTATDPGSDSFFDVYTSVNQARREAGSKGQEIPLTKPSLAVKSIAVHPTPLKAGTPVNLYITFENKGNKASAPDAQYKLACAVLKGGPECPVPSSTRGIGHGIEPGHSRSVTLMGAKPAAAGEYGVSVAVPPDQLGRPYSITLNVAPASKPVKPAATPPSPPSGERRQIQPKAEEGSSQEPRLRMVPR